jgi:hypothetical protein
MKITSWLTAIVLISSTALNAQQISYDSLVSLYPLNVNAKDAIGKNDGLIYGAVPSTDRFNHENGSFHLDGYDDYINLRSNFDYPERTINIWFNADTIDEISRHIYISDNPGLNNGFTQIKILEMDGKKLIRSSAGIPGGTAEASSEVEAHQWYMITLVASQDSVRHYLNGDLIGKFGNATIASSYGDTSALLGTSRVHDRNFKGKLDDVRIYKRTLNPGEIISLFNEGKCVEIVYDTIPLIIHDTIPVFDTIPLFDTVPIYDTIPIYVEISVTDTLLFNLGIADYNPVNFDITIKIYPNPTKDYLFIETNSINGDYRICIINSLGSKIFETNLDQYQYSIDLSTWTGRGVYVVQLIDSHQQLIGVKKIILE